MAPKVTFMPSGASFEAKAGDSLLKIARDNDVGIQHACGGFCACTTCHVHVVTGASGLAGMEDDEDERLGGVDRFTMHSRLACQAKVVGTSDVVVTVINEE